MWRWWRWVFLFVACKLAEGYHPHETTEATASTAGRCKRLLRYTFCGNATAARLQGSWFGMVAQGVLPHLQALVEVSGEFVSDDCG